MNRFVIEIQDLSLSIENKDILKSVSVDIAEGDFASIIGPNGAGKTSLLRCLMRIIPSYDGSIRLFSRPADKMPQKELARLISYVPQSNGRLFPFTVREFVMMGRYPYLSPFTSYSTEDKKAVQQALEQTGITPFSNRPLNTLSGGERQIVFIAAAIAQGARLMVLDEPVTFLDPGHTLEIYQILKTLNRQAGITIIMATHDINSAALNSHRVIILKQGKIAALGTPGEVIARYGHRDLEQVFIDVVRRQDG
jgi:iron complex transport system ATP-binding protein